MIVELNVARPRRLSVTVALLRAFVSFFHPRMLALLVGPVAIAIVFWAALAWYAWDPVIDALRAEFFLGDGVLSRAWAWSATFGVDALRPVLLALIALMLLLPLMFASSLLLTALVSMPVVTSHLGSRVYPMVARRGSWSFAVSLGNATWVTLVFAAGYLLTTPLWLVPALGIVVPWLWWGWYTARVLRIDSLVEHAAPEEMRAIVSACGVDYLLLGLAVSAFNLIPPFFLVTPVFGALAFSHYSFARLRELRSAPVAAGSPGDEPSAPGAGHGEIV